MREHTIDTHHTLSSQDIRARDHRIRTFIIVLAIFVLPFTIWGIISAILVSPNAGILLALTVGVYLFLGVYYLLLRQGYGVPATYACIFVLTAVVTIGVYNGGGFIVVTNVAYLLIIVSIGLVLNEPIALDIAMVSSLLGYIGSIFYQFQQPPEELLLLQEINLAWFVSIAAAMVATVLGIWFMMRQNIVMLRRSYAGQRTAQQEAETRANENATLLEQIQTSNADLLTAQARLRETVDALALPLIPLEDGVALLPLVGYLDQTRADRLLEGLLQGIHEYRARTVIVDITGLREVDDQIAETLLQVAHSSRLLGAQVVLSGVGAEAARALVARDADLQGLRTTGRLQDALQMAIQQTGATSGSSPKTNGFSFES
ncbi:MAG: STAS domain-containing protein [Chloroflexota bacterium]